MKIFIVEDETVEVMALMDTLKRLGYDVAGTAFSGEECLEKVPASRPDLIIMDIKLGGAMDGIDTAWELRKEWDIPVVFTTALSDSATFPRATLAEPYGYIVKPFNDYELYTTIETSLYKYRIDRKLKESEAKYRSLFEQSRDAIFMAGPDAVITDANRAMQELTGYPAAELAGSDLLRLLPDAAQTELLASIIRERGFIENREVRLARRDGSEAECLLTFSRIGGDDGSGPGFQGIIRDITSQKRLERVRDKLYDDKIKRVKELNFLYGLAKISGSIETPLEEIFNRLMESIPAAFQNPASISARIIHGGGEYRSERFRKTRVELVAPIRAFGAEEGRVEIYRRGRARAGSDPSFPAEDRDMVNAVAERLGVIIERKRSHEELIHSREELRGLTAHLQSLREAERTEIAREIHDVLGQTLTAMKMDLSWIQKRLGDRPEDVRDKIGQLSGFIDGIIDTVRRLSSELRPDMLDDLGLAAAIEWYAEEFQKRTGVPCRVSYNTEEAGLDGAAAIGIYRIFQEALTNIIRHAEATEVSVDLVRDDRLVTLTVSDNGRGITAEEIGNPRSLGLVGIRERALSCGGAVAIHGAPGKGTTVKVEIPLGGVES